MIWRKRKAEVKRVFENLEPSRGGGFTTTDDGLAVLFSCHDTNTVLVLDNETDLHRARTMIDIALKNRNA